MTSKEAIDLLKIAKAEIEWDYNLEYQLALQKAIEALDYIPISKNILNLYDVNLTKSEEGFIQADFIPKNTEEG